MVDPFRYMMAKWLYGYSVPLRLMGRVGVRRGSRLLIIGSGIGETAILTSIKKGCTIRGLEIHPALVEEAERRAVERGLSGKLSFDTLSGESLGPTELYDAVIFESILSFLPDPAEALSLFSKPLRGDGRIGVLEPAWISTPEPADARHLAGLLGGASIRPREEWVRIFEGLGLRCIEQGTERLGLLKKLWDDLSASPLTTLRSLAKTLYTASRNKKSREAMRDFRRIIERYSGKVACAYYILEKGGPALIQGWAVH